MDRDAERKCRECHSCQVVTQHYSLASVKPTKMPDKSWQDLALDLLGPMPTGEHVVVPTNYFSRWIEVDIVRSTLSKEIIKCLDAQFTRHGILWSLRTDNAPNFVSSEMESYPKYMASYLQVNNTFMADGQRRSRKTESLVTESYENTPRGEERLDIELNKYLLAYRSTPSQLLHNRGLSCKLPDLVELEEEDKPHQDTETVMQKRSKPSLTMQTRETILHRLENSRQVI